VSFFASRRFGLWLLFPFERNILPFQLWEKLYLGFPLREPRGRRPYAPPGVFPDATPGPSSMEGFFQCESSTFFHPLFSTPPLTSISESFLPLPLMKGHEHEEGDCESVCSNLSFEPPPFLRDHLAVVALRNTFYLYKWQGNYDRYVLHPLLVRLPPPDDLSAASQSFRRAVRLSDVASSFLNAPSPLCPTDMRAGLGSVNCASPRHFFSNPLAILVGRCPSNPDPFRVPFEDIQEDGP